MNKKLIKNRSKNAKNRQKSIQKNVHFEHRFHKFWGPRPLQGSVKIDPHFDHFLDHIFDHFWYIFIVFYENYGHF